jgi:hypothetical protein
VPSLQYFPILLVREKKMEKKMVPGTIVSSTSCALRFLDGKTCASHVCGWSVSRAQSHERAL